MRQFIPYIAGIAYAAAALGLGLTGYLVLEGFRFGFGHYREADGVFHALVALLFFAGGAYVCVWHYATIDITRREAEKWMWSGCPSWMKFGAWALCAVGLVLFFGQFVLEQLGWLPKSDGRTVPTLVLVGFGLI